MTREEKIEAAKEACRAFYAAFAAKKEPGITEERRAEIDAELDAQWATFTRLRDEIAAESVES